MKKIKVGDIASCKVISIDSNSSVGEASELMKEHEISSLLVKDGGKYVGIITDKDFVLKLPKFDKPCCDIKVKEILSSFKLITIEKDARIEDAVELMRKNKIRHLVVVDNGEIIGVISLRDLLAVFPDAIYAYVTLDYLVRKTLESEADLTQILDKQLRMSLIDYLEERKEKKECKELVEKIIQEISKE